MFHVFLSQDDGGRKQSRFRAKPATVRRGQARHPRYLIVCHQIVLHMMLFMTQDSEQISIKVDAKMNHARALLIITHLL